MHKMHMSEKDKLIAEQREIIDAIQGQYKLTLTEIARQSKVASTTLTRFYNGDTGVVLSSFTLNKILDKFPVGQPKAKANEYQTALAYSIKLLILLLTRQKTLNADEVSSAFADGVALFRQRQEMSAANLLDDLRQFATIGASPTQLQELRTLLSTIPQGLA